MRRREGELIPLEVAILGAGLTLRGEGEPEFHGFQLAKELRDEDGARGLTAHGTLYKALDRMERAGLLQSRWEDPDTAMDEGRPRRRLYRITAVGQRAFDAAAVAEAGVGLVPEGSA
jgi:DNA-binding PadR family transcriptional regulator